MKERFEELLQDKLQDFSMKPEPRDWTAVRRSVGLDGDVRRPVPLFRYVAAAAVVLLAVVCGLYFRHLDPVPEAVPQSVATASMSGEAAARPVGRSTEKTSEALEAVLKLKETIDRTNNARQQTRGHAAAAFGRNEAPRRVTGAEAPPETPFAAAGSSAQAGRQGNRIQNRTSNLPVASRPVRAARSTPNGNWALSLFADGASGIGNLKFGKYESRGPMYASSPSGKFSQFPGGNAASAIGDLYETNRMNDLFAVAPSDWEHSLPLSFGISVHKNLTPRWGIETGLTYSYLDSRAKSVESRQQLHYLGIPVAVTYDILHTKDFDLYARAGGAAGFNIAGRMKYHSYSKNFTVRGVQWSASANLGVMYNISPGIGFYFEPGIGHYFEYSNQPDTYWSTHPAGFDMKIGIRTNF